MLGADVRDRPFGHREAHVALEQDLLQLFEHVLVDLGPAVAQLLDARDEAALGLLEGLRHGLGLGHEDGLVQEVPGLGPEAFLFGLSRRRFGFRCGGLGFCYGRGLLRRRDRGLGGLRRDGGLFGLALEPHGEVSSTGLGAMISPHPLTSI
ncbi:hypothetical protein D3C87_1501860 [compost metagenome]